MLVASRLPRLLAALLVGLAVGVAGATLQSVARNPLASPDTLAVNAGAYVSIVAVAAFGITMPFGLNGLVAFAGGLAAAGLVLLVSRGGAAGPDPPRAGRVGDRARPERADLGAAPAVRAEHARAVRVGQRDHRAVRHSAGRHGRTRWWSLGLLGTLLLAHRLDVLGLGDDSARVLGVDVRRTRVLAVVLAVLLAATAVTVAGPIGFVGLCAPVIARLVAPPVPGLGRHALLLPLAGVAGRARRGGRRRAAAARRARGRAIGVPTGVVTTLAGAVVLVWLARRLRDGGPAAGRAGGAHGSVRSRRWVASIMVLISSSRWSAPSSPRCCSATGWSCSATSRTGGAASRAGR